MSHPKPEKNTNWWAKTINCCQHQNKSDVESLTKILKEPPKEYFNKNNFAQDKLKSAKNRSYKKKLSGIYVTEKYNNDLLDGLNSGMEMTEDRISDVSIEQ